MTRRDFLSILGATFAGASLARCSFVARAPVSEPDPPVADLEKLMAQDVGALRHTWTAVQGITIHSLVSSDPASPDAPVIVLVHGSGLSGRYMIPTAQQVIADCRVYVPDLPGFGDNDKPEKIYWANT